MFIVINDTLLIQIFYWTFFKSETPQTLRRNIRLFTFHTGHKSQVSNELNSGYD